MFETRESGRATPIAATPYTGPNPSPARAWAPWVVVTSAVTGGFAATQCVLNLVERHYQRQRRTFNPPSVTQIRDTLNAIHTVTTLTLVPAAAFLVVGVVWSVKRRPRNRLRSEGEVAVEPALRRVAPITYVLFWAMLATALIASFAARSTVHPAMSIGDFVTYRTLLALSAGARAVMWLCWTPLVVRATKVQSKRATNSQASTMLLTRSLTTERLAEQLGLPASPTGQAFRIGWFACAAMIVVGVVFGIPLVYAGIVLIVTGGSLLGGLAALVGGGVICAGAAKAIGLQRARAKASRLTKAGTGT